MSFKHHCSDIAKVYEYNPSQVVYNNYSNYLQIYEFLMRNYLLNSIFTLYFQSMFNCIESGLVVMLHLGMWLMLLVYGGIWGFCWMLVRMGLLGLGLAYNLLGLDASIPIFGIMIITLFFTIFNMISSKRIAICRVAEEAAMIVYFINS